MGLAINTFCPITLTITKKCGKTQKLGVKKEILHSSDDHRLYSRF